MKAMKKALCLLLAAVMLFAITACSGGTNGTAPDAQTTASAASDGKVGDHDGNIVVAVQYDLGSFNTGTRWANEDFPFYFLVYDRLFEYDEDTNAIPHLVEEETILSDTQIQYKIHQGAKFSDGTEIKAKDVAASIMHAVNSKLAGEMFDQILSVDVKDDYTVIVNTADIYPQLNLALADPLSSIHSADFLEKAKADPNLWSDPVCSGRYKVKSRVVGSSVELIPNEYWWDAATAPQNDSITFKVVPEASTRTIMVQTGEADLCDNFSAADIATAEADPNVAIHRIASARYFYIFMNVNAPEFQKKEVRQALNYAIDREACLLVQEEGCGQVMFDYVAPACMGYVENPGGYEYNPEKAKELLKAAGAENLTFDLTCDASFNSMAALIQAQLAEIGVTCNIVTIEQMPDIIPLIDQGQCNAGVVAWSGPPDDALTIPCTLGEAAIGANNFSKYVNPELEALFSKAYDMDDNARTEAYREWEEILCEDCPWIPLYVNEQRALANADLKNVEMCCIMPYNLYKLTY